MELRRDGLPPHELRSFSQSRSLQPEFPPLAWQLAAWESMVAEKPENQPILSHWRRLAGMVFEPRRVMEDLARQPRWILPVVLSVLTQSIHIMGIRLRMLTGLDIDPLGSGREEVVSAFLWTLLAAIGELAVRAALLLVSALAFARLMRALSRSLSIRHALAIASYSLVPGILVSIVFTVHQFGVAPLFQLESSFPQWFSLSLRALLDGSTMHPMVYMIAGSIGVVPLWRWLLVALGLTIVVRSVSFWAALGAAIVVLFVVESLWTVAWMSVMWPSDLRLP